MWHILKCRPVLTRALKGALATLLVAGAVTLGQTFARADAVDDLRLALPLPRGDDPAKPTPAQLDYRRELLQKKINNLKTIGDLRRALALAEWKDTVQDTAIFNKKLREMEAEMRQQVGLRLTKAIQDVVKNGDRNSRLAAANCIAEIGPTIRSIVESDTAGFARSLTPEVIQLAKDKDLGVRQEALRALGNIFPRPQDAVPILRNALEKDAPVPKRLAADGLGQMIRVVNHLQPRGRSTTGVEAFPKDVRDNVVAVLEASLAGLKDDDPQIRALCLQNIQVAAEALADLVQEKKEFFPPEDRVLTADEKKAILELHDRIHSEIEELAPAIAALRAQGPSLVRSLEDPDSRVRLAAVEALENIGNFRVRLKKRVHSVPVVMPEMEDRGNRKLLATNDALETFIANNLGSIIKLLGEASVPMRRKAIEFLDIIEDAAAPALPLLAASLNDPDRFVRWSAARAIGNIEPAKAAAAVPGLGKLLSDPDLSIRLQAAKTLKDMGAVAHPAVPALAKAVTNGDAESRLAAMETLQAIGPDQGKLAVPHLIEALANPDARVRRLAARTLGGFGPDGFPAIRALTHALGDEDQEVRVNASDAVLNIMQR